ncbi:MAG: type II toxin-antitoxin system RelE/ParE family toxin [Maricaulaceae bacterium]|nr:type II toxin-antitoxin system RelE/ParE family toxin [Maricaulaceae bacterium]
MLEVRSTARFSRWLDRLKDERAKARIALRIRRVSLGNFGDVKSLGDGVSELRIDYGPGYRVYFFRTGGTVVVLLAGGDKRSQSRDIAAAKALAAELKEQR